MPFTRLLNFIVGPGETHRDSNGDLYSDRRTGRPCSSGRNNDSRPSREVTVRSNRPTTSAGRSSNRNHGRRSPEPSHHDNSRYERRTRPTTSYAGSPPSPVEYSCEDAWRDLDRRNGQSGYRTYQPSPTRYTSTSRRREPVYDHYEQPRYENVYEHRWESYEPRYEVREPQGHGDRWSGMASSRYVNCGACGQDIVNEQSEECRGCGHFHYRCIRHTQSGDRCPNCYESIEE